MTPRTRPPRSKPFRVATRHSSVLAPMTPSCEGRDQSVAPPVFQRRFDGSRSVPSMLKILMMLNKLHNRALQRALRGQHDTESVGFVPTARLRRRCLTPTEQPGEIRGGGIDLRRRTSSIYKQNLRSRCCTRGKLRNRARGEWPPTRLAPLVTSSDFSAHRSSLRCPRHHLDKRKKMLGKTLWSHLGLP